MAETPETHGVVRKQGPPRCTCGQTFDTDAQLIEHLTGQPVDEEFQLLMAQLIEALGAAFMETVSNNIREQGFCEDRCICAPLTAYTALYHAGWTIVPIEEARQLHALRGRVN